MAVKILAFIFFISLASFADEEVLLEVPVGQDKIEKFDYNINKNIAVGNEAILDYRIVKLDEGTQIVFKGLKPGKTTVTLRKEGRESEAIIYKVNVTSDDLGDIVLRLRDLFKNTEGIKVDIQGGIVVVEGKLNVPDDIGRVAVILERTEFKDNVIALVELSNKTQSYIAQKMQDEIHRNGMKDVSVRVLNGQFLLEGFITRAGDDALAIQIAESLLPDRVNSIAYSSGRLDPSPARRKPIQSRISPNIKPPPPPPAKQIKIIAQFVELLKDYSKIFGFTWTPGLTNGGGKIDFGKKNDGSVTSSASGTLSGTISNLFPRLSSAKKAGNARVIQQGMIVTKDGTKDASIKKVTTIPFGLGSGEFTQPKEAEVGFQLKLTPVIQNEDNIELGVSLSVSISTGNPPIKTSNDIFTTVVVKSKESAVIGGISTVDNSTQYDKDPPGGETSFEDGGQALFSFVRSKSFTNSKSQFAMFLTPEIIQSASQGVDEIRRKFRRRRR